MFFEAIKMRAFSKIRNLWLKVWHEFDLLLSWPLVRIAAPFFKVRANKIVFTNFSGNYDCNPKYICEEVLRRNLPYEIIWVVWGSGPNRNVKIGNRYPTCVKLTDRYSYDFYKHLFTAHMIIDNGTSFASAGYPKKRNQLLLNTWHGSLGIKRFPKNDSLKNWRYNRVGRWNGRMIDFMISNSEFEESYYKETYFSKTPTFRLGHARNDPLFETDPVRLGAIRMKVCNELGIDVESKICLYAPTFRDDNDIRPYNLPYERIVNALAERFGGKWVVVTRFHHRAKKATRNLRFPDGVISATAYPDIVELMVAADMGITDYSSWICEYIHTRRPAILYATDVQDYDVERGFYDPIDAMPFPFAADGDSLVERIANFDIIRYQKECAAFIEKKGCMEDGHAAERIVDLIEECMEKPL